MTAARRIRICYALNSFEIGGAETVALDLARSHDPERFQVEVAAFIEPSADGESEMRNRFRQAGVKTVVLRQPRYRSPVAQWRIFNYLRRGRFDIVHGHNRGSDYWGARLGLLAGIPHRFWTRHLVYRDFTPKQLRRYAGISGRCDRVIAVSDTVRDACIETEGIAPEKVVTIVNGIDTLKFAPLTPDQRAAKRSELGVRPDELMLLFVGRFSDQKAPETFPPLVEHLRRRGLPVRGFMCGYGPLAGPLDEIVRRGPGGTEILGMRSDVPALLGACDLFVSTSRNEGLPLNVMEAMAAGAPFAAPSIPQIGELVAGTPALETRLYQAPPLSGPVDSDLVANWAGKVADLLADHGGMAAAGQAGRRVIEDRFSLRRMVDSYEELFLAACGVRRQDRPGPMAS